MYEERSNRLTSNKTDWKKYIGLLEDREELEKKEFLELEEADKYRTLTNTIKEVALEAIGKKFIRDKGRIIRVNKRGRRKEFNSNRRKNRNPVEWWHADCDRVIKDRARMIKVYKKLSSTLNNIKLKRCIAIARKTIKEKKRGHFKCFAASLNRFINTKYVRNKMNVFKNRGNTRKWNLFENEEYVDIAKKEMNKVAPCWIENSSI